MPMFDTKCMRCGEERERYAHSIDRLPTCGLTHRRDEVVDGRIEVVYDTCGGTLERIFRPSTVMVDGDECDFIQENGTPTPIHFRSKQRFREWLKESGNVIVDRHVGVPGTDKSPHTTRWGTMDAQTLANATALVGGKVDPIEPDLLVTDDGRVLELSISNQFVGVIGREAVEAARASRGRSDK